MTMGEETTGAKEESAASREMTRSKVKAMKSKRAEAMKAGAMAM
jgi:hypothetical protein